MIQVHTSTLNDSDTILDGRSRCLLWCKCQLRYTLRTSDFRVFFKQIMKYTKYNTVISHQLWLCYCSFMDDCWFLFHDEVQYIFRGELILISPASFQQFNNYNLLHISMVQFKCRSMFTIFDYIVYNLVCRFNRSSVCSSVWLSYFVLISES